MSDGLPDPVNAALRPFRYRHRVRYRECDPMGVAYHAHAVDWFEAARTEALRAAGMPYRELEASGILLPVVDLGVRYRRSVHYDDLIEVAVTVEPPAGPRLQTRYAVCVVCDGEAEAAVRIEGEVLLCFVDAARGRPVRAPERVAALLR